MTTTGFAEFVSSDVRDHVIKQVETSKENFKVMIEGKEILVRRARARRTAERNAALRGAADTIKKLAELDTDVEIEWGKDGQHRGVKVKGSYAFMQPADSLCSFTGEVSHLDL